MRKIRFQLAHTHVPFTPCVRVTKSTQSFLKKAFFLKSYDQSLYHACDRSAIHFCDEDINVSTGLLSSSVASACLNLNLISLLLKYLFCNISDLLKHLSDFISGYPLLELFIIFQPNFLIRVQELLVLAQVFNSS